MKWLCTSEFACEEQRRIARCVQKRGQRADPGFCAESAAPHVGALFFLNKLQRFGFNICFVKTSVC